MSFIPPVAMRCLVSEDAIEPPVKINLTDPNLYSHGDPYAQWRWLREHEPVYWHPAAELPGFWALTKYDDARAVYRDPATFSSAGGILLRPENYGDDPGGGLPWPLRIRRIIASSGQSSTTGSRRGRSAPSRPRCGTSLAM